MDVLVSAEDLCAGYDGKAVVSGLNLELRRGGITALIGPNGSGKSTILKTLAGQLPPVSGRVFLKGRGLGTMSEREIASVMSVMMTERVDPELMTCEDVVSVGRFPYTGFMGRLTAHDRDVIRQALETAHVFELKDRDFNRISDGQRQRVLLARAICQEPEVLIMDEPTGFLDIRHKLELLQVLMKMVRERGTAVLISMHEIELTRKFADTVICLKDGKAGPAMPPADALGRGAVCRLFDLDEDQYDWLYGEKQALTGSDPVQGD